MQNMQIALILYGRGDTKGQSMLISVCKCIETLAPMILGGFVESVNIYIIMFGAVSIVFDMAYVYFLLQFMKQEITK